MSLREESFQNEGLPAEKQIAGGQKVIETIPHNPPEEWKRQMVEKYGKMPVNENSLRVLSRRYLKKDEEGATVETPEDMIARVTYNIALAEGIHYGKSYRDILNWAETFYSMINSLEFMPNSPTLMNAGKELQQLSACFVIPVDDSMESIFNAVKYTALIHKSGGGTGFSFSRLRPKNDVVRSTKGISSGPISFMTVFDAATETIKQGGTRRGANMGILKVDHPDILEFITCKQDNKRLNNFNISVAITEEFIQSVLDESEYPLINPSSKNTTGYLNAKEVFDKIVESAWKNGEPGIIFLDRINRDNPTPSAGEIESTNPCGEQPLLPFESCNLGSINLARMLKKEAGSFAIDYEKLRDRVFHAVRFLDNVIDMNNYPLPEIREMTLNNRKIGLGVMGFADLLLRLKIPYNSEEALGVAREVMNFIQEESNKASGELAKERGPFPNFGSSVYAGNGKMPLRNATTTTIAPTGTISIISSCSSGIEPLFALVFVRNVMDNDKLLEANPIFEDALKHLGLYSEELMEKVSEKGSLRDFDEFPDEVKNTFVTAFDVSPTWHLQMQATFQEYVDNAVSKTVNFPNHASKEDVSDVFHLAYRLGCKGVTVYRDGSREEQVLNVGRKILEKEQEGEKGADGMSMVSPRPRPDSLVGITKEMKTGCGKLYITMNMDEKGLFEIFNQMGKAGGCASSQSEAIGRLVSLALRSEVDPRIIIKQLKGISCQMNSWANGDRILSCADAVGKALEWYLKTYTEILPMREESLTDEISQGSENRDNHAGQYAMSGYALIRGACPDCGSQVEMQEGCLKCRSCGYTEC